MGLQISKTGPQRETLHPDMSSSRNRGGVLQSQTRDRKENRLLHFNAR